MRLLIVLLIVLLASPAVAQELDTASQFWYKVRDFLGQNDFSQYDTTDEVKSAVNAGLRAVATDIPINGSDTVEIVANTFLYTLNDNFISEGLPGKPLSILRVSTDGSKIHGVSLVDPKWFGVTQMGGSAEAVGPVIVGAAVKGRQLWIYPAEPPSHKLYIDGPIDAEPHTNGESEETTIPETDRYAAVYWAVAILAESRGQWFLADRYMARYDRHVANRKKQAVQQEVQQ